MCLVITVLKQSLVSLQDLGSIVSEDHDEKEEVRRTAVENRMYLVFNKIIKMVSQSVKVHNI